MSVKIRLTRFGAKKVPYYKIIVADSRCSRDGKFIESIGSYNPLLSNDNPQKVSFTEDRAKYWLSNGAKPSDRVALFFGRAGLIPMPAIRETPKKSAPRKKQA